MAHIPDVKRRLRSYFRVANAIAKNPSLIRKRSYVFLLGHMRAYTTLLSHILGSHSEVSGYAECGIAYLTPFDLIRLRCIVSMNGNYKSEGSYIFDKILHNHLTISDPVLRKQGIDCIFLIRRPLATLRSMVKMHHSALAEGREPARVVPATIDDALRAYGGRLAGLVETGERVARIGKTALVVQAEDLIDCPAAVLSRIQRFLRLNAPLDEAYSLFRRTGEPGSGDPSRSILKGRIERQQRSSTEISVSDRIQGEARRAYEQCLARLLQLFPNTDP